MIHELRIYTLHPGKVPAFLKLAEERARVIRGDDYGKCEGYWFTEFGTLNQVVHLWSYDDLNDRADARARLGQNADWANDYVAHVRPLIRRQEIRLMHPRLPLTAPENEGNVYEYRYYKTHMGEAPSWTKAIMDVMPARERYSKNVCLWHTEAENPNEVSHMWAYKDLNERTAARAKTAADPDWQAFLKSAGGKLEEMQNMLLIPAPFSPLK
ncbi:MAG: NIPSNAP family protein [Rhodospirillaceae bacterium]|jgi:hypothetical protein|nr:NIPSNAP family protein [Rhodospirillaceae bacterium]MBT4044793.1 NIPSNAP family protein [Rhodospirillaceae bacterium]MBT4687526.1 NIPSNAP family protein [Rhodospirillaceae bacterium]MBT5080228.1 NIPSNAP family protein [Rhodospirillaceae bacterium]MBT5527073.1 NIPSNAP family protein [Rhodospirillaceae bacterium]